MKRLLLFTCVAFFAISCNNDSDKGETKPAAAASADVKYDYAYTLDEPYKNWQPGDQQHVVNVLKSLKAWETGDIDACMTMFADSVDVRFDGFRQFFIDKAGKFSPRFHFAFVGFIDDTAARDFHHGNG